MMQPAATITTLIPTYRRPRLLGRAIRSVMAQTYPRICIAVFDNASGDETEEVVRALAAEDERVAYHRHATNIGLLGNYNFGMRQVSTPYFSFLADDDILYPRFYEEAVRALEADPDAYFFAGRTLIDNQVVGVRQLTARSWASGRYEPGAGTILHMIDEHFIGTSCLFRRQIVESIGVFEACASDRNYMIVAAAKHPFVVSESPTVEFTIHPGSFSGGAAKNEEAAIALDAAYVLALHQEIEARLTREGFLASEDGTRIRRALWRKYRMDIWWTVLTKTFPAGRAGELEQMISERARFRFSHAETLLLWVLARIQRSSLLRRAAAWTLSRVHKLLLVLRERGVPPLAENAS